MRDELGAARQRLAREIDSKLARPSKPIAADPWVVSSLLQKSIRRGEGELAQRAAFTFFHLKGAAVWRRLMVIAFEDVGIGSVDALTPLFALNREISVCAGLRGGAGRTRTSNQTIISRQL
jgi:replication-associated recombination protein RarA